MEEQTMTRFANIEVANDDDINPAPTFAPPPPVVQVAAAPAVQAPPAPQTGDIDPEGAARANAGDALAKKAGLAFSGPTFYAFGTVGGWGGAASAARAEISAQPLLTILADAADQMVEQECRRGDIVPVASLVYTPEDIIKRAHKLAGAGLPMSVQALKALMTHLNAPGGCYLADDRLTGELRASHVKAWLDNFLAQDAEKEKIHNTTQLLKSFSKRKPFEPARLKLLSKLDTEGQRSAYGVVGEDYPYQYGMDRVIRDVMESLPPETRGRLTYDASTTRWQVEATLVQEFAPTVGEIHRLGIKFGAHDAGSGAYHGRMFAVRVRCINFTLLHASKKLGRVRHVGDQASLRERVLSMISTGAEVMKEYSDLYKEANETAIIDRAYAGEGDARTVFAALVEAGRLPPLDGASNAVDRYFTAWLKEPGMDRASFINAATRAAHESSWSNLWAADVIEEAASNMLYQHVVLTPAQYEAVA
jgi:hypothetical protein